MDKISKKAQEEMVGFGLIIVIVAVIMLVFLFFTLRNQKNAIEDSNEVEAFVQASLHYTTDCQNEYKFLSVREMIKECENTATCLNGKDACDVLNKTLNSMIKEAWNIKSGSYVKGYSLNISSFGQEIFITKSGENTSFYKSYTQPLSNNNLELKIYY